MTNLRGAPAGTRSRGELVRAFVTGNSDPLAYARSIDVTQYAGFHLLVGEAGGDVVYLANDGQLAVLDPGVYAFSNAPTGEHWPKEALAIDAMQRALASDAIEQELLRFLTEPRHSGAVETEVFIESDRYGTRASTVIVATEGELRFVERGAAPASGAGPEPGQTAAQAAAAPRRYSFALSM